MMLPMARYTQPRERPATLRTTPSTQASVLFQTALIESGYEIADPSALVNRVYR